MQHCQTLAELTAHFDCKLSLLHDAIQLHGAEKSKDTASLLCSIGGTVHQLNNDLSAMKQQINRQKEDLVRFQKLKESILEMKAKTDHAQNNLPTNLPKKQPFAARDSNITETPVQLNIPTQSFTPSCRIPSLAGLKKAAANLFVPPVDYLTVKEFQSIPKYMKGRLTYDQVNDLVSHFNRAMDKKYQMLHDSKSKRVSEATKRRVQIFKSNESKETSNVHFITDTDLSELGRVKLDSVQKSVMTILRHFGRIREIRGQGVVRYAVP